MPEIANYAAMGAPKPGAVVLMNVAEPGQHRPTPLLAIENYGLGRTAILATEGTWRWKMLQDHTDRRDFMFWKQLMRWLVTETPGQVTASTPHQVLSDDTHVPLRAVVRDKTYDVVPGAVWKRRSRGRMARCHGRNEARSARARHLHRRLHSG